MTLFDTADAFERVAEKVARCFWRGVGPPSCSHNYCPPGLSSPNFTIAGKVTRIWVGCLREIYCLWVVIIMATGNIKTVYDIFQSMESGPSAAPTYPIAQVSLLISLASNAWFNCPKVMLWCMLGMFDHFSRWIYFNPVGPLNHAKFINSLTAVAHKTNMWRMYMQ